MQYIQCSLNSIQCICKRPYFSSIQCSNLSTATRHRRNRDVIQIVRRTRNARLRPRIRQNRIRLNTNIQRITAATTFPGGLGVALAVVVCAEGGAGVDDLDGHGLARVVIGHFVALATFGVRAGWAVVGVLVGLLAALGGAVGE